MGRPVSPHPTGGGALAQLRGAACLPTLLAHQERGIRDSHGPQGETTVPPPSELDGGSEPYADESAFVVSGSEALDAG